MPYLRDFQLVLREHDRELYKQLLPIWDPIEIEVRRSVPSRFSFGGVGKIVLELGPQVRPLPEYRVLLNVGLLHWPDFDVRKHLSLATPERTNESLAIVETAMASLATRFDQDTPWLDAALARIRGAPPNNSFKPNPLRGSA
jgi:hypothetical protein